MLTGPPAEATADGVAIIGMAGRFPHARNVDEFWQNIRDGRDCVSFFTDDELLESGIDPALVRHPRYVKARAALDGTDLFDASFFGYTPREAQAMDPQQRLFLECAWSALEHAGYYGEGHEAPIGVYAGLSLNSYMLANIGEHPEVAAPIAADKDYLTTRVSYKLNLKGPSLVIQTACSTSLVAVCQACQGLLTYQCDLALAGGMSIVVPNRAGYFCFDGGIYAPDGRCRPFDAGAQGTVPGSGGGIVVLKRLGEAIADGDTIHAVIRGFAVNNDGAGKIGYTAPSVEGQAQVIQMAQALAGVSADTISCLEAHGTGTVLGDPIEIAALTQAFRATTDRTGYCAIGSLKSNIGHLDAAAGIASLIKTALALRHRTLPPTLHFERPNPNIDFPSSPFYVNTAREEWPSGPHPRRAGVSSFGIGGTNAHVVLEEAPPREPSEPSRRDQVLVLSARTAAALETATEQLAAHLAAVPDANLADVAYTLQVGRKPLPHRRAVVCSDIAGARTALETPQRRIDGAHDARARGVVFMFPGQGVQHIGMGAALYADEPAFRAAMDRCAERFEPALGSDLRRLIYDSRADDAEAVRELTRTSRAQAALFATEYALAQLWMSWGVMPSAMIGHSVGEIVAACLSGVLSLDDAIRLVAARGVLMEQAPAGAMLAVAMDEQRVQGLLGNGLWLAAVNAPEWCVVAGDEGALADIRARAAREGVHTQLLRTSGAFHSGLMSGVADPLTALARSLPIGEIRIPYVSNVTGTWIEPADVRDSGYWARHVCATVRFAEGIRRIAGSGSTTFLEVGPGQTLGRLVHASLGRPAADGDGPSVVASMRAPGESCDERARLVQTLGRLWSCGVTPDWKRYHARQRRLRVELPTYPFESKRYWFDRASGPAAAAPPSRPPTDTDAPASIADWFYLPSWKRSVPPAKGRRPAGGPARYLVLGRGDALERELVASLGRDGQHVAVGRPGSRFQHLTDGSYVIDPASAEECERLLGHLREAGQAPTHIVHLWACDRDDAQGWTEDAAEAADLQFFSLLHLAQAIGALGGLPLRITVVTSGVHDVANSERLRPERALALGPCRVIPQEYPGVTCRMVDVVRDGDEQAAVANLAARLAAEIESDGAEPVVAYRGIDRWVQSFEKVRMEPSTEASALPRGGTYLITGGLGGVGLAVASYFAQGAGARLVLTSREGLPPRDAWEERLRRAAGPDRVADRIRSVQALERLGATVTVARADVCDEREMRAVVERARAAFGRIDGVVHAAGVPAAGVIQLKTRDRCAAVLAPKVRGTTTLLQVFADEPPGFIVLCSSLASIVGGIGQVDYCAANAFLDAVARASSRNGMAVLAINWDRWRDVGMAVDSGVAAPGNGPRAEALHAGLSSADGVEAFARALGAGELAQIAVSTTDFREWMTRTAAGAPAQRSAGSAIAPKHPRPRLQNPYVAPTNDVQASVCDEWQHVLGVHPVGIHDSFFELGGHSVLAIELVARVNRRFATTIPVAALYDGLTPAFLADRVQSSGGQGGGDEVSTGPEGRRAPRPRPRRQPQRRITRRERNVTS